MPLLKLNPPAVDTDAVSSLIYTPTEKRQVHFDDTYFYLFLVILLLLLDTVVFPELVPFFFSSGCSSQKQSLMYQFLKTYFDRSGKKHIFILEKFHYESYMWG